MSFLLTKAAPVMEISSNGLDRANAALLLERNDLAVRPYGQVRASTADRQCGSGRPPERKGA
jgi:hypothetical protein